MNFIIWYINCIIYLYSFQNYWLNPQWWNANQGILSIVSILLTIISLFLGYIFISIPIKRQNRDSDDEKINLIKVQLKYNTEISLLISENLESANTPNCNIKLPRYNYDTFLSILGKIPVKFKHEQETITLIEDTYLHYLITNEQIEFRNSWVLHMRPLTSFETNLKDINETILAFIKEVEILQKNLSDKFNEF